MGEISFTPNADTFPFLEKLHVSQPYPRDTLCAPFWRGPYYMRCFAPTQTPHILIAGCAVVGIAQRHMSSLHIGRVSFYVFATLK
jgi:hypothetical protein